MSRLPPKSIHKREQLAQPGRVLAGVDDILRRLGGLVGPFKRDTVNDFVISHVLILPFQACDAISALRLISRSMD
jgi:hypothetical protein